MELLYWFESIRMPVLDVIMQTVTRLGEETVFMLIAMLVFWCVDKRRGYYLLSVGFVGTLINQWLKIVFRVPRPWVLDPNFQIVDSAKEAATGYSFPSGHTQSAVGTLGGVARFAGNVWLKVRFCNFPMCPTRPFQRRLISRLYVRRRLLFSRYAPKWVPFRLVLRLKRWSGRGV